MRGQKIVEKKIPKYNPKGGQEDRRNKHVLGGRGGQQR